MADNLAFTFVWKIKMSDIAALRKVHDGIASAEFFVDSFARTCWWLVLFPFGFCGSDCFNIILQAFLKESIKVQYELSFLGPSKCISHVIPKTSTTSSSLAMHLIDNCPTQEEVFVTKRSLFLPQNILTLQLKLWKTEGVVEKAGHCWHFTEIISREYRRWFTIDNFCNLKLKKEKTIKGSIRESSFIRQTDFTDLMMNIRMKGKTKQEAAVDVIVTPNFAASQFPLSCKLSLLDVFGKHILCRQDSESSDNLDGKWKFTEFFTWQEIIDNKSNLLVRNNLRLTCDIVVLEICDKEIAYNHPEFWIDENPSNRKTSVTQSAGEASAPTLLQDDLLPLYENKTFCDFELRAGDATFPVHRVILAARSPVFRAAFVTEMRDATSGVLDIPDVDADTLDKMLEYIYTDAVSDLRKDNAAKLYYAADKYLLSTLKRKCTSYLRTNIDLSNVCEILELAHRHSDEDLKSAALEFLIENMNETVRSPEWIEFMAQNTRLASEVMHALFSKVEIKKK